VLACEGPRKALGYISFGIFDADVPRFRQRLDQARLQRIARAPRQLRSRIVNFDDGFAGYHAANDHVLRPSLDAARSPMTIQGAIIGEGP
jgi:hypothetical protein